MNRIFLIAALFSAVPLAAQAQSSGKWEVKVEPSECTLIRSVQAPSPALIAVRTVPGTDAFVVLVSGKEVPNRSANTHFAVQLHFDDGKALDAFASPAGKLSSGPVLRLETFKPAMLDAFAAAQAVSANGQSGSFASFQLPSAAAAVRALRQCIADQLVDWGADPAQFAPGGTLPVPLKDRDDWLTKAQLIDLASTSDASDIDYLYQVVIATDGSIESCKQDKAKAGDRSEKLGCAPLIGKKLFTPAKNAAGTPVKGAAAFQVMLARRPGHS